MRKVQTSAFDASCLRQVKEERQTTTKRREKQRRGQTRRKQPSWIKGISRMKFGLVASFSSVLFSASFFFLLLSVFLLSHDEDFKWRKRSFIFFSSFVVHRRVHFPSSFPHASTSAAVTRFFFETLSCVHLSHYQW